MQIHLNFRDGLDGLEEGPSFAEEAERRREALSWFVLPAILNAVGATPLAIPTFDGGVNSPPPGPAEGWRSGTGRAQGAAPPSGLSDLESVPTADTKRIAMTVDAGELGTIGVVVEHTGEGLRLILAVESAAAEAVADLHKTALIASLRASGVSVAHVSISRTDGPGTLLADKSMSMKSSRMSEPNEESEPSDLRPARRSPRRLDMTG